MPGIKSNFLCTQPAIKKARNYRYKKYRGKQKLIKIPPTISQDANANNSNYPAIVSWKGLRTSNRLRLKKMAFINSANDPSICIIILPEGVVVSMFSVIDLNPAPTLSTFSRIISKSFKERDRRSSFQTTRTSFLRSWSSKRCNSGLSHLGLVCGKVWRTTLR